MAALCIVSAVLAACGDGESTSECDSGFKLCDGECVSTDLPEFGCADPDPSCNPCRLERATSACSATGVCAVGSCEFGWGDCNNQWEDGCETNHASGDINNCGQCDLECDSPWPNVAEQMCANFNCEILRCDPGFADEDDVKSNGCEAEEGSSEGGAGGAGHAGAGGTSGAEAGGAGGAEAGGAGGAEAGGAGGSP